MVKTSHPPHPPQPEVEEALRGGHGHSPEAALVAGHWSQEVGWHTLKIAPDASGRADETSVGQCLRRFIRGGSDRGQLISVDRSSVDQLQGSSILEWSGHPLDGDDVLLQVAGIAVSGFTLRDAVACITHCLFRQLPEDHLVPIHTAPLKGKSTFRIPAPLSS